jgi:hypothetical protein
MTATRRPNVALPDHDGRARAAVEALVDDLQSGLDAHNAAIADRRLTADIAWGSPYGATMHDFDTLYAIHRRLKRENAGGSSSRYRIVRILPISPDVIVAQVARDALDSTGKPLALTDSDEAFSEMAMYVLVLRENQWWLAAGQNTPIRPGGAV